ncbi:hypothetical protein [Gordonia sp. NPDC003422]
MTRLGRNAIRRSEKEARRRNREEKRGRRVAAGVAALATVAAVGAGQVMADAPAMAATPDYESELNSALLNPTGQLGDLIADIAESNAGSALLNALRIQMCANGGTSGGADCSLSSEGIGIAVVLPDRIELVPRVAVGDDPEGLYNGIAGLLNSVPPPPKRSDYPAGLGGTGDYLAALLNWGNVNGANGVLVAVLQKIVGVDLPIQGPPETTGSARVIGYAGNQFALAFRNGNATAISFLPISLATAGASDGETAFSFALVGMAHAWNTGELPLTILGDNTPSPLGVPLDLPEIPGVKGVSCYGGLTVGYASGVGACANIVGTFDFRWNAEDNEFQFALTDPTALISDPIGVLSDVITDILGGQPFTLSKDFARLSIGGSQYDLLSGNFFRLTSDYGFDEPVEIDWLGQKVTLYPMVDTDGNGTPDKVNYLGLPQFTFGDLNTSGIVPSVKQYTFNFPFGISPASGPYVLPATPNTLSTLSTFSLNADESDTPSPSLLRTTTTTTDDTTEAEPEKVTTIAAPVDTTEDEVTTDKTADTTTTTTDNSTDNKDQSNNYVGKHRSENKGGYVGKHRSESKNDNEGSDNKGSDNKDSASTKSDNKGSSENKSDDNGSSENKGSDSSSNSNSSNSSNNGSGNES